MDYKLFDSADLKFSDAGYGELAGYASIFNNVDAQGERVMPGAFEKSLPDFLVNGFVALGHDWNALPIATPIEAKEDTRGLYVKAAFHSTPEAQNVRTVISERLARGKSVKLSIGYEVVDAAPNHGVRELKELKLHEWSYVAVPANPLAAVTFAKGAAPDLPFVEYTEFVVSTVEAYADRARNRQEFRAKEGRVLSSSNRNRIQTLKEALASVLTDLDELLRATEQPVKVVTDDELKRILEKWSTYDANIH